MKRKIVKIDEVKCNGCGLCIPNCPEGALQIIDGKARIVSELSCDGLGACLGHCPEGAISIEEREAEPYNERKVMASIIKAGPATIKAHLKHLADHQEINYLQEAMACLKEHNIPIPDLKETVCASGHHHASGGCPGSRAMQFDKQPTSISNNTDIPSQLRQWPVQLALLNPQAPYFNNAHLLIAADCVPFAYGNFHQEFLKDKVVIVFCPKLDPVLDIYLEKLVEIFRHNPIQSITIARMEVPCCSGATRLVNEALRQSGQLIPVEEKIISLKGVVLS